MERRGNYRLARSGGERLREGRSYPGRALCDADKPGSELRAARIASLLKGRRVLNALRINRCRDTGLASLGL
jgi:hypothetical protein